LHDARKRDSGQGKSHPDHKHQKSIKYREHGVSSDVYTWKRAWLNSSNWANVRTGLVLAALTQLIPVAWHFLQDQIWTPIMAYFHLRWK
jgi:hypothetical protein